MNRDFKAEFSQIYNSNVNMHNPHNIIAIIKWYNSWANLILAHYGSVPLFFADMHNCVQNNNTYLKIYDICNDVVFKLDKSKEGCIIC